MNKSNQILLGLLGSGIAIYTGVKAVQAYRSMITSNLKPSEDYIASAKREEAKLYSATALGAGILGIMGITQSRLLT